MTEVGPGKGSHAASSGVAPAVPAPHAASGSPTNTQSAAEDHDWRMDIVMPDDRTQTLADVLDVMRSNDLQRQAAFVEWLAGEWYDAKAELQSLDMGDKAQ
jgi:hypothetical protein